MPVTGFKMAIRVRPPKTLRCRKGGLRRSQFPTGRYGDGRTESHYGWVVAGSTFLVMLATAGAMGAPGVIIQPLEKEFGWSTAQISVALAVRLALFGLIAPFAAAFINRFGVRPVVVSAVAMIVTGILASMAMTQVWELVALWGVIVGIGTGMVALVLGATIATRWFVQRRGLVVGMLTASSATGQLIFLPLIAKLTQDYGWRSALVFVVAMLLVALFVALMVLRDRPADVGLAPFGERAIQPAPKQDLGLTAMMASPLLALYAARTSRTFWVLFGLSSSAASRPTASSRRTGSRSAATMALRQLLRLGRLR